MNPSPDVSTQPAPGQSILTDQDTPVIIAGITCANQREILHAAISYLAGRCDHAQSYDGQGFSKLDATTGNRLATKPLKYWSNYDEYRAAKVIQRYKRTQLKPWRDHLPMDPDEALALMKSVGVDVSSIDYPHGSTTRTNAPPAHAPRPPQLPQNGSGLATPTSYGSSPYVTIDSALQAIPAPAGRQAASSPPPVQRPTVTGPAAASRPVASSPPTTARPTVSGPSAATRLPGTPPVDPPHTDPVRLAEPPRPAPSLFDPPCPPSPDHATSSRQHALLLSTHEGKEVIEISLLPYLNDFVEIRSLVKALPSRMWDQPNRRWILPLRNDALVPVLDMADAREFFIPDDAMKAIEDRIGDHRARRALSKAVEHDIDLPGIVGEPFGYQKAGIAFLLKTPKALCADQMGLGKTLQAIATAVVADDLPMLVCAPASLKINWIRELRKWAPTIFDPAEAVAIISGKFNEGIGERVLALEEIETNLAAAVRDATAPVATASGQLALLGDGALAAMFTLVGSRDKLRASLNGMWPLASPGIKAVIVNYDILESWRPWLLAFCQRRGVKTIVCDEAHRLKTPDAQRTMAVMGAPRNKIVGLAEHMPRVILLTGTPVVNRPEELWTLIRILGLQKHFGSKESYERNYAYGGIEPLRKLNQICRALFMVRRTKDQVLTDLPPKVYHEVPVELSNRPAYDKAEADIAEYVANRRATSDQVERDAWEQYPGNQTLPFDRRPLHHPEWLEFLEDHKKEVWGEHYAMASRAEALLRWGALKLLAAQGKQKEAIAWIEDFLDDSDESLVVFGWHTEIVQGIARHFSVPFIDGSVSPEKRMPIVDAFMAGRHRLLVGNMQAMGEGLTLTKASNVAFLEYGWSPKDHDQAEDRCHRIGQHDNVTVHNLVGIDTIEEEILTIIAKKRVISVAVQDGGEAVEEQSMLQDLEDRLLARAARRTERMRGGVS